MDDELLKLLQVNMDQAARRRAREAFKEIQGIAGVIIVDICMDRIAELLY